MRELGIDARLLPVGRDRRAVDGPFAVLPAHGARQHVVGLEGLDRAEDLRLLVAHRLGLEGHGRLHGDERQELEQVVRHHVAQGARVLVVAGSVLDAQGLGDRDLHVVDVAPVPDGLEDGVGEAEGEDVLDRLFAEVVIDAVDLLLGEHREELSVELHGRLEAVAEGLLDDDAAEDAAVLTAESGVAELLHDSSAKNDGGVAR